MLLILTWLAQAPVDRPAPDPRLLLDRAVTALGGVDRISRYERWYVTGTGRENLSAELQGLSPSEPTYRPHEERVAVVDGGRRVAWERRTPRNDGSLRWRRFIQGADSSGVVDWVAGYGALRANPAPMASRLGLMRRIPHLLLAELVSGGGALASRAHRGGRSVVAATLPNGVVLTLGFDSRALLSEVEYQVAMPGAGSLPVRWTWSAWRPDPNLGWVPGGHRIDVGGILYQEVRYTSYQAESDSALTLVGLPSNPARFLTTSNDRPTFPSVAPSGNPAPGVSIISVRGLRAMLVEFADHVVLVEAPEQHPGLETIPAEGAANHGGATRELKDRIAALAGGKPLRYVVITHHHDDHLGGLGGLATTGTTVLVAPGHRQAAARALAAPPVPTDGDRTRVAIEPVATRRVLADSTRRMEIINVGDNPHTTENLMVWLPNERIVFQGDLFYFEPDGPFPPSGRGTMNRFFAGWLERRGIRPVAIYGVHNPGAAGADALRHAITEAATPPRG